MSIKEQIHDLSDEMITNIGRLVAIDSQLGMPGEGKPFGEGPAEALKEGLKIAEELGFKTVNLDNYCGYAEMGEGEEIVGIAGRVQKVPTLTPIHLPSLAWKGLPSDWYFLPSRL